jgi:serine/threonine-protein kinase
MAERERNPSPYAPTERTEAATHESGPSPVGDLESPLAPSFFDERYAHEQALGEGGMGRVLLYKDAQIGRRVAVKMMKSERAVDDLSRARFLREARIQAQLEHPAIVPVYDLGVTPTGSIYFTMKRVRGVTLRDILEQLVSGDIDARKRFTRRRLLTAFSSACLAIELAHERGVLHRDLKPENVMLGDFGEVYVLDWGVAKLVGVDDRTSASVDLPDDLVRATRAGAVLGTPGYMAPEQLRGTKPLGPSCDIYALGAILFELLTLEPLHSKPTAEDTIESTIAGADARASVRAPDRDIAPELDAVCVRATATAPEGRFASARDLSAAIERFLDGERDVELRRTMAAAHARKAAEAASSAGASIDDRREAMRNVGRALALDPDNHDAAATMARLLTEPPRDLPPEVFAEMERSTARHRRWMGRVGAYTYASVFAYVPLVAWVGIKQPLLVALFFVPLAAASVMSLYQSKLERPSERITFAAMILSNLAFAIASVFYGPLVVVPAAVAINATAFAVHLQGKQRVVSTLTACFALIVPMALEALRVTPASYAFANGAMTILPRAVELPELPTLWVLAASGIAGVLTGTIAVSHVRDALGQAEKRLYVYAWHLRELVPETARPAPGPPSEKRPRKATAPRADVPADQRTTRPMSKYP